MIILGIDPGYERVGFAILAKESRTEKLLFSECFKTPKELDINDRILLISQELQKLTQEYPVEILAIENLFFQNNQKTAMRVAEARGAIITTAKQLGLAVYEYTPLQIKQAITGYGKADKSQVHMMVKKLIALPKKNYIDDEIDAIAITLTHSASHVMRSL